MTASRHGHKTGFWLEEFAGPIMPSRMRGQVKLASPKGGQPRSIRAATILGQTDSTRRFKDDDSAQAALAIPNTGKPQRRDFDAIFYAGGQAAVGPRGRCGLDRLIEDFWTNGKPVAAVCHGGCCATSRPMARRS